MNVVELREQFGMEGVLEFAEADGLVRVEVTMPTARATVYLQGAHVTEWQPEGFGPVLFLSEKSAFVEGKAIRGGIPICFPWFGPDGTGSRDGGKPGPMHGFARIEAWKLALVAMTGEQMHLTLTLGPTALSRSMGYDGFRAVYQVRIGRTLTATLTVANDGGEPMEFEEALHSYYAVGDVREVGLTGLQGVTFRDKTDGMRAKVQEAEVLEFTGTTDRVYEDTTSTCVVEDRAGGRKITIEKTNSASTVVWNPWAELAKGMADMDDDGWVGMVCVETANVRGSGVTLGPGQVHSMGMRVGVEGVSG